MNIRIKIVLGLVLITALIVLVILFNFKDAVQVEDNNVVDIVEEAYLKNPVINFPKVENRELTKSNFNINTLPLEFRQFAHIEGINNSFSKIIYSNVDTKTTFGFEIKYSLKLYNSYSLSQFYQEQLDSAKNSGWKILATNLESKNAFIEAEKKIENTTYKAHLQIEDEVDQLKVMVQFLITNSGV